MLCMTENLPDTKILEFSLSKDFIFHYLYRVNHKGEY